MPRAKNEAASDAKTVVEQVKKKVLRKEGERMFDEHYARLNAAQKSAVDTIEGPVMVVAGPGTGKTQVLGVRVANILRKTQVRPGNILCLTYSTSGATAMRERLRELIGGDAYAVTVNTIHGFCDSIINRNPQVFEEWAAGKQLSDIEKYRAMQSIIDEVSATSIVINPKDPYGRIPAILGRISECKREGKTLEDLLKVADEYDVQMAGKSKEGTKAHAKNILAAKKFRDFIDLFERYQSHLKKEELYDYEDMILVVLKALSEEDWLLAGLQEQYQYIHVDEAQDLNGAQWKVVERLTTYENVPHEPNFFLVGDDDQSIYRFQGANLEHMLAFRDRFSNAPVIVLTENYRSTQRILDAAGRLIAKNEERLVGRIDALTKDLTAFTTDSGTEPILLRAASDSAEPWLIADLIDERLANGVPADEIAVLTQTNAELRPIYDVLHARNIPVVLHGKADLLSQSIVLQALTILRSTQSDRDDPLIHALACECFGCHPADIARLIQSARSGESRVAELLSNLETSETSFISRDALIHARTVILDLKQKQESRTVLETVEHALRQSGLSAEETALDPLDLAVIEEFFHYVKQRTLDHPSLTLREFMDDLSFYADENFSQIRLTYQIPHLVTNGVQLLTAHQSKGLEFHTVILSNFRDGHWDQRRNPSSLSLPEDLLFGHESDQKKFEKHQDERRVAYVAMTRAKRELLFVCPREMAVGERARAVSPSAFFAEAGPLPEEDRALSQPEASSLLLLHPKRDLDSELVSYLREKLETFALSATSLTRFLKDPEEFKRVDLLGQPEAFDEKALRAMGYGTAVHWALRQWATALQERKDFGEKDLLDAFEWNLRNRNALTEKQRSDLIGQAHASLSAYFQEKLLGSSPFIHAVERNYSARLADLSIGASEGIPIKGKIDRIDLLSATSADASIIDYKTGRVKAPGEIRGGLEAGVVSKSEEGAYFRQLVFYALLLEQAEPLLRPQVFSLEFVGEREEETLSRPFTVTESEKDDLRKLIRDVWAKIQTLNFSPL